VNTAATSAGAFARLAPAVFVLLWSTGFVGAKFGLPYSEPVTFMWYRYTIVSALLGAFVLAVRAPWPRQPLAYVHLAITGLLLHGVYIGGVFIAIAHGMSSGIAALIVGVQPLLTATLVGPLLGERLSARQWLGFFVGFAGLVLTVLETLDRGELPLFGLVTCLCALLAITFGTLYQKRHTAGVDSRVGALVQFMATAVAAGLVANLFETRVVEWHPRFVFALAWLCLALSLGAISILWALIRRGAAARVASLFYLVPPVTALEGYFLFGETLHPVQMLGIATTAIGVALINR
jgi:drug/metabolite transporter (DMT)-like permease